MITVLPYAGTSGWSGTDTSRARAEHADSSGSTGANQRLALDLLADAKEHGLTVAELRTEPGLHHGSASGALSLLHKAGMIARLEQSRGRCKVYVLPEYVQGRVTEPHGGSRRSCPHCGERLD